VDAGAITVSYDPTLRDVLHAARVAEGTMWKRTSRIVAAALVLFAVWCAYCELWGWAALFAGIAVGEWFNLLPLSVLVAWLEFRRNPKWRQRYHLTLSPDHLAFRTETIESKLRWENYTAFSETPHAFVLSYGLGSPTVIPKAAFKDDAERDAARRLLTDVVTNRRPASPRT
jgi:hypothetical protein